MQLFYNPDISEDLTETVFTREESRHMAKVLRKQPGDLVRITNGNGAIFEARLLTTDPKRCVATIEGVHYQPGLPYSLHMAVAPTKLNDRYEWFLEKATEIGATEITPIICAHSERKVIKPERYEKILLSAMKQSLKAFLPKLNPAVSFESFLANTPASFDIACIAHCYDTERSSLKSVLAPKKDVLILIGPEGDFSPGEVNLATQNGFEAVSLGSSRLRTETAAIAACHSVAFINEPD